MLTHNTDFSFTQVKFDNFGSLYLTKWSGDRGFRGGSEAPVMEKKGYEFSDYREELRKRFEG